MKKRILAGVLSILMVVGLLPTSVFAAEARGKGDTYTYTANFAIECDKNITVSSKNVSLKQTWEQTNSSFFSPEYKEKTTDSDQKVTITAAEDYVIDTITVKNQGLTSIYDTIFENCISVPDDYSGKTSVEITLKAPSATTGNVTSPSRDITITVTAKLDESVLQRTIAFMIGESGKATVDGEEVENFGRKSWKLGEDKTVTIEADDGYYIDKVYLDPDAYNTGAPELADCEELQVTASKNLKNGIKKKGTVTIEKKSAEDLTNGATKVENTLHISFQKIEVNLYATEITDFYAYNETAQDAIARWEGGADKYLINEFVALEGKDENIHCTPALTEDDIDNITVEYLVSSIPNILTGGAIETWKELDYELLTRHFGSQGTETIRFSFGGGHSDSATVIFEKTPGKVGFIGVNSQTIEFGEEPEELIVTAWASEDNPEEYPEEIPDDGDDVDTQDVNDDAPDEEEPEETAPGYIAIFGGVSSTESSAFSLDGALSLDGKGDIWDGIKTNHPDGITLTQLRTELSSLGVGTSNGLQNIILNLLPDGIADNFTFTYGVPTDVGVYLVTAYIAETSYEPNSDTGYLTITRRTAKLKFDPLTFVYDGQPHAPEVTLEDADGNVAPNVKINCTYYGKKGGSYDKEHPLPGKPTDAGEYLVRGVYSGAEGEEAVTGEAEFEIEPAPLELQIDDVEKFVGEKDPDFTYKLMRVTNPYDPGDAIYEEVTDLNLDITLVRDPGETAGEYFIYPDTMSDSDDWDNWEPELPTGNYEWCGRDCGLLTIKERSVTYSVKLSYESNGGTAYADEYYIAGSTVRLDKIPVRAGCRFTGWYLDRGLTQPVTNIQMYMNRTVYAGWEALYVPSALNSADHIAYVKGFEDGTVRPEANITRAETAMMLYRLLTPARLAEIYTTANSFGDVSAAAWYNEAVSTMANGGYINGLPDGTFGGGRNITRAEFAAILVRFIGVQDVTCSFTDVAPTHWAYRYIATAAAAGWITGTTAGTFEPDREITRAEAMTIINRVLDRGVNEKSTLLNFKVWPDNVPAAWYYYDVIEATNGHTYVGARPSEDWTGITVS